MVSMKRKLPENRGQGDNCCLLLFGYVLQRPSCTSLLLRQLFSTLLSRRRDNRFVGMSNVKP